MGYLRIGIIIILLSLIGKGILGFAVVLPFLLALTFYFPSEVGFAIGFFTGILLSILHGGLIGQESIGILLAMGLLYVYSRRFSKRHLVYSALISALGVWVYSIVVWRGLELTRIFIQVLLVLVFIPFVKFIKDKFFTEKVVLKI